MMASRLMITVSASSRLWPTTRKMRRRGDRPSHWRPIRRFFQYPFRVFTRKVKPASSNSWRRARRVCRRRSARM